MKRKKKFSFCPEKENKINKRNETRIYNDIKKDFILNEISSLSSLKIF